MALLPILLDPDPLLRVKTDPVTQAELTPELQELMHNMLETMYDQPGVGIAAPQVGIKKRLIVIDPTTASEKPRPMKMINPTITWKSEETSVYQEGCFSFPQCFADVTRPSEVKVKYRDEHWQEHEVHATGLFATVVQHEIDHLDGILFVDYLSPLKRKFVLRKLAKIKKQMEQEKTHVL